MRGYNPYRRNNNMGFRKSPIPVKKSNKKIWLFILIPIFVLGIAGSILLFIDSSSKTESQETGCIEDWDCTDWSFCSERRQTRTCTDLNSCETTKNKPITRQRCEVKPIDCGNIIHPETFQNSDKFDCFIDASVTCEPAILSNTFPIDLFGLIITTANDLELKTSENNKCIYYQKTINQTMKFNDEIIQLMLDNNITQEEIDQEEKIPNEAAKEETWGLEYICKFNTQDLNLMLSRWKSGIVEEGISFTWVEGEFVSETTGDFEVAECETIKN